MLNFFIYVSLTMFTIWVIQKMKLFDYIFGNKIFEIIRLGNFMRDLRNCRLCLGYWISLGYYFLFGQQTFTDIKILDAAIVALLIDFLVYYAAEGIIRNHVTVRM